MPNRSEAEDTDVEMNRNIALERLFRCMAYYKDPKNT